MTAVAVSPDMDCEDTLVATSSVKGTIRLWTLAGNMVASIPCHKYGKEEFPFPLSHSHLGLEEFPFPIIGPLG